MASRTGWVLLAYRLPREPSTPRISAWRKLRQLGAAQIVDGLAALPSNNRTREQVEWMAQDIREAGGEASVWEGTLTRLTEERALVASMSRAAADDYRALIEAARAARTDRAPRRAVARLRRELHRIRQRDYFGVPEGRAAENSIERLASLAEVAR